MGTFNDPCTIFDYPVVRRERAKELWLFIFPIKWEAIRGYQEFPNPILVDHDHDHSHHFFLGGVEVLRD